MLWFEDASRRSGLVKDESLKEKMNRKLTIALHLIQ